MGEFEAVLFDWRGTLVVDWPDEWWIQEALAATNRTPRPGEVASICEALAAAGEIPGVAAALQEADLSADQHRAANMAWFDEAGLDAELATTLYDLDFDSRSHPFAADAIGVLSSLRDRGVRTAVVSDIHFDLRPEFDAAGMHGLVDAFVLSFEHGVCKPDPAIFRVALDALGVSPEQTLMVGDRPGRNGGATQLGATTLLLPTLRRPEHRRLHLVLRLMAKEG
jgi:HAD superfamily hydrolase (TIGR01509 family)